MKNKNYNLGFLLILIWGILFGLFFFFPIITDNFFINNDQKKSLNLSSYLEIPPFIIDETGFQGVTWAEVVQQPWCSGNGTPENPYIIENVSIRGGGRNIGIYSSNAHFIIRNSRIIEGGQGIFLMMTDNGKIINNNFSLNSHAISMETSVNNILISNNSFTYNAWAIRATFGAGNNNITDNIITHNEGGIIITYGYNWKILRNNCSFNGDILYDYHDGIFCHGDRNDIIDNILNNNRRRGLFLIGDNNTVYKNEMINNGNDGIYITDSRYNNITKNEIRNNSLRGILLHDAIFNMFSENLIMNNQQYGVYNDALTSFNTFYNNTFIGNGVNARDYGSTNVGKKNYYNNSVIGNFWDDYDGKDENEDNIGDTPYLIIGPFGAYDYLPIWDDGPDLKINSPSQNQAFNNTPPVFNIEHSDPGLHKIWYVLNQHQQKYFVESNGSINDYAWAGLEEGIITLSFYANDTEGNVNFKEIAVIKDISNPEISIIEPINGSLFGQNAPNYNITVFDLFLDSIWYTLDGGITNEKIRDLTGIINQSTWIEQSDGNVLIQFFANDTIGHKSFKEITVIKDTQFPNITIFKPYQNQIFGHISPNFSISVIDPHLDVIWYTINDGDTKFFLNSTTGMISTSIWDTLDDGMIVLRFYANDTLGHEKFKEVLIEKLTTPPPQPIINEKILGYDIFIILGLVALLSIVVIVKFYHKLGYS